jgi:hypothetical protein
MGKFDFSSPPPLRKEKLNIQEWDPDEEFMLSELSARECQALVAIAQKLQEESEKAIELYADVVSRCLHNSEGERPPKDWLMQSGFNTLRVVAERAMKLNGLSPEAEQEIEKN